MPFGQVLAYAERSLTGLLKVALAAADVAPQRWYALQTIVTRGPVADAAALRADLARSPNIDAAEVDELLNGLAVDGLIQRGPGEAVELTPAGAALHRSLRERVDRLTATVQAPLDPADIATTKRTLQELTARAEALSATPG
jgi:DNA-binding MarR family transcriptional regulator